MRRFDPESVSGTSGASMNALVVQDRCIVGVTVGGLCVQEAVAGMFAKQPVFRQVPVRGCRKVAGRLLVMRCHVHCWQEQKP